MAKKQTASKTVTRKITKALACKLTEPEVLQYGRDMAQAYAERERLTGELDAIKGEYKGKIAEQDAAIGKLQARVHSGMESRDVECVEEKNWTAATVRVTRTDTHEVIESRPMREDEKQVELSIVVADGDGDSEGE
jgi:hypothetical protein